MQRRTWMRCGGYLLAGVVIVAAGAAGGHRLAQSMAQSVAFHSLPPDADGVAWVACRHTVGARRAGDSAAQRQAFCQRLAERLCGGAARYLGPGDEQPEASRYRERFRCARAAGRASDALTAGL